MRFSSRLAALASLSSTAVVCAHRVAPRQASASVGATTAASAATPIATVTTATGAPVAVITPVTATTNPTFLSTASTAIPLVSITQGEATMPTAVLYPTLVATPGAMPPISGAPALPTWSFTGGFPALDVVPPTNSPQVAAWIAEVAASGINIPNIPVTVDAAACASNPGPLANATAAGNCWWTCGGCVRPTDITTCPEQNTWGLSYDDGPSDYTANLLNFMHDHDLSSTFFIVGSRAVSRPTVLQAEYMAGHQLSVHTWSHPALTTLTNEQIIAELGWTREAIRQITGVSPNTMRPPYGDIDDRVRAICAAMKLTPIIWTELGQFDFDFDDWHIPSGQSVYNVIGNYEAILQTAKNLSTGFIVLEHDLYEQTVELATDYVLPDALARTNPSYNLMSIIECQKKPLGDAYVETNNNATNPFAGNASPLTGTVAVTASSSARGSSSSTHASSASSASATKKSSSADSTVVIGGAYKAAAALALGVMAGGLVVF